MKRAAFFVLMAMPLTGGAEVYRCQDGGTTVFSATPCGPGAKVVVVTPASGAGMPSDVVSPKIGVSTMVERADALSRRRILEDDIWRKQKQIEALQAEHEVRQAELRAKKSRANNNLAGATWEKSISEEMQAAAMQYDTRARVLLKEIEDLRSRRDEFKALK